MKRTFRYYYSPPPHPLLFLPFKQHSYTFQISPEAAYCSVSSQLRYRNLSIESETGALLFRRLSSGSTATGVFMGSSRLTKIWDAPWVLEQCSWLQCKPLPLHKRDPADTGLEIRLLSHSSFTHAGFYSDELD